MSCGPSAVPWRATLSAQQETGNDQEPRLKTISASQRALKGSGVRRARAHFCHRAEQRKSPDDPRFVRAEPRLAVSHSLAGRAEAGAEAGIAAVLHTHESAASLPALTR